MRLLLPVLLLITSPVAAQVVGGRNVELGVTVLELTRQGDTTTITYQLTIEPTSAEGLLAFLVEAPTVVEVSHPLPPQDWVTGMRYQGFAVARWTSPSVARLAPGSESPPLTYRAIGVPGIVDARVMGHYERIHGDTDDAPEDQDAFLAHSSVLRVVGVVSPNGALTARDHAERLRLSLDEACALGWVRAQSCELLHTELAAVTESNDDPSGRVIETAVAVFIARLDTMRGQSIGDSAYWLFRASAELIAERAGGGS